MALYKCVAFLINREIFIPNREIGRFSLLCKKSGDLPNRERWKFCTSFLKKIDKNHQTGYSYVDCTDVKDSAELFVIICGILPAIDFDE